MTNDPAVNQPQTPQTGQRAVLQAVNDIDAILRPLNPADARKVLNSVGGLYPPAKKKG